MSLEIFSPDSKDFRGGKVSPSPLRLSPTSIFYREFLSADAFVSKRVFKSFYVKNTGTSSVFHPQILINGGGNNLGVYPSNESVISPTVTAQSLMDNYFYKEKPPFNPTAAELNTYSGITDLAKYQDYLTLEVYDAGVANSSTFRQFTTGITQYNVLNIKPFTKDEDFLDFLFFDGRNVLPIVTGRLNNELLAGESRGFIFYVETAHDTRFELYTDYIFLNLTYFTTPTTGKVTEKPSHIELNVNYSNTKPTELLEMVELYRQYPLYFQDFNEFEEWVVDNV